MRRLQDDSTGQNTLLTESVAANLEEEFLCLVYKIVR